MTAFALAAGILTGVIGVLSISSIGAAASRFLGFNYALLVPLQMAVWILSAWLAASGSVSPTEALTRGAAVGLVVGVIDSTIGWRLSLRIHPALRAGVPPQSLERRGMLLTAFRCTALATATGGMASMWLHW